MVGDRTLYSKYRLLAPDALMEYVFKHFAGLDVHTYVPLRADVVTSRDSQIVFVPKSMRTKRVISKEPATLLYFQKGVDRAVRKYIAKHAYLRHRIDLNDQTKQRVAALEASRTRRSATVDLSAASDSVSYDLVKRVFHGTPLYPYLVALRSRSTVLPSGRKRVLAKFAPMGSALCFPVETLIFAAIVECTAQYVHATQLVHSERANEVFAYRVYGDDIIVSDLCLEDLIVNLRWCGFRTNEEKTYGGSHYFRESCGCDAYDGHDVTPMRISRNFSARGITSVSPGVFAGLIDMANQAESYGFTQLRRYLVDKLINGSPFIPAFSQEVQGRLYSPTPTNYRIPHRTNRALQREEVKAAVVRNVHSQLSFLSWSDKRRQYIEGPQLPGADDIRYFEWLRRTVVRCHMPLRSVGKHWYAYDESRDASSPDFASRVNIGTAGTYLTRQWINNPL